MHTSATKMQSSSRATCTGVLSCSFRSICLILYILTDSFITNTPLLVTHKTEIHLLLLCPMKCLIVKYHDLAICSRVRCISNIIDLSRVLSSRWIAVLGDQVTNLVRISNRKQPGTGRGCLPHQCISSRAEKKTLIAEGTAVTIAGATLSRDH